MATKTVGSRELKNRLGTYLRQVREGTTIIVTDRGRAVAELRALAPVETDEEERLEALVASGLLAPRIKREMTVRKRRVSLEGPDLASTIVEDREDRF